MTYCDGENDDREVDPDGDNNTNCQELDQDYGTARLWHSTDGTALMAQQDYGTLALVQQDYGTLALVEQDDML